MSCERPINTLINIGNDYILVTRLLKEPSSADTEVVAQIIEKVQYAHLEILSKKSHNYRQPQEQGLLSVA